MAEPSLARVIGVPGAVLLGLGSILGTGIFVSVGIAAGVAGSGVILAVVLAAVVATFNGLSSAQLAAAHPVSGGTYEYGYRTLNPTLGFTAGWMFLCAKSASAATAALGLAGYVLTSVGESSSSLRIGVGIGTVLLLTAVVAGGMQRSNRTNAAIVTLTLLGLGCFVALGARPALESGLVALSWPSDGGIGVLHATALMFVAFTGYGRIATLGEEVREPKRSIPRAIVITLIVTLLLYAAVTTVAVGLAGAEALARATDSDAAPLIVVARTLEQPAVTGLLTVAAVTAMAGVVLNLLLGLSRVLLAMGRRGDMPEGLAVIDEARASPVRAVLVVGVAIASLVAIGSVETTWSFSAFTVLVYYAITNLAALRLPAEQRRFPRVIPALGLICCLGLAFWVEPMIWGIGLGLIAVGLAWRWIYLAAKRRR
ncbi:MAG TPA: APC family permease [Enhygromyxa sp.]|nr:APC family permease [Enhygromyxa sp.]